MTRFAWMVAVVASAAAFTACGKDEPDEAATFSCGEDDANRCEKNTDYCVVTYDGETELEASCHALPASCTDCDCIQEDEPATSACGSGITLCTSVGTSIFRVECDPAE